jgi:hypothetical protein
MIIGNYMVQRSGRTCRRHIHLDSEVVGPPLSAPNDERRSAKETNLSRRLSEAVSIHPLF